jgi:hypothetical protein
MRHDYKLPTRIPEEKPMGIYTPHGRCYDFWAKVKQCENKAELPNIDCQVYFDDYVQCLDHSNEVTRFK